MVFYWLMADFLNKKVVILKFFVLLHRKNDGGLAHLVER